MSKAGKFLFLFSFVFFFILLVTRLAYGGWHDGMWGPLGLSVLMFVLGMAKDLRAVLGFLTMRTTKHGMNMGALIALVVIGLACVNYLSVRYERKFDWTKERLNSLSDQSVKAVQALDGEVEVLLLYNKNGPSEEDIQKGFGDLVGMYQNVNRGLKFAAHDVVKRPDLAQQYDFSGGAYLIYLIKDGKRVKVDPPTEEGLTRGLLKLGRDYSKTVYFTMGHGEKNLEDKTAEGLSILRDELGVTYSVKPLVLFQENNKVPEDAAMVAVIGPQQQFLETELQALREYARRGGRLLVAIDPGKKHNLAQLTKTFGVEFANSFILDARSRQIQAGPAMVLGTAFDEKSEITAAFSDINTMLLSIFYLASPLSPALDRSPALEVTPLVSTGSETMSVPELKEGQIQIRPNGPHHLALKVTGELQENVEFAAVVFGDSDFFANNFIHNNLNRDLAMNTIAYLAKDKDLISIRPKEPKGTKLAMTGRSFVGLTLGFIVPLPIGLFLFGGLIWWRRRTA
jgi:ABC-type uncharacterized transport system involved in gliding motility auxiliary subunit